MTRTFDCEDLITLFGRLFEASESTILVHAGKEPIYLPADEREPRHRVGFAHGFFASALHEIAHWCVAGPARRLLPDFGYWYVPDGRTPAQQREFEQVEVAPQALEWIFSVAAGTSFNFSADNLALGDVDPEAASAAWRRFQENVLARVRRYLETGLPRRAAAFAEAVSAHYGTDGAFRDPSRFTLPGAGPDPARAPSTDRR